MRFLKRTLSLILVIMILFGVIIAPNNTIAGKVSAQSTTTVEETSFWSGAAATEFAGGSGSIEDPYIIATADQLYLALSVLTDTGASVAGGKKTGEILKESSTTDYVPVYTPYYYKVADGVKSFYLNNIKGNESLNGIKGLVAGSSKKNWQPKKSFVGNIDGNGVTIYGMYSSTGDGFIYKFDGAAEVKNFNFDSCYSRGSGYAAIVSTRFGAYTNDSTVEAISNVSVRNCYIETTMKIAINASTKYHSGGAAGLVSTGSTAEKLTLSNCLFDGYSCEVIQGAGSAGMKEPGYVSTFGGIISGGSGMNNVTLIGCISLGAPIVDEICDPDIEVSYTRYDKNKGFRVYFYNNDTDYPNTLANAYPGTCDKLFDISRLEKKDEYTLLDMPAINWISDWELVKVSDTRVIPMPKYNSNVNTELMSYALQISQQNNDGGAYSNLSSAYDRGTYGMTHELIGSGTEKDPYIIYDAFQLARAIASGGMSLYNRLYYKLACDIDAQGLAWISQDTLSYTTTNKYIYTEFNGVLDGDGHTVSGIFVGDDQSVGLIPILAKNGVVKNLHVRDSWFVSGDQYAGAIVGDAAAGSQILGCSVENCVVVSQKTNNHIVGRAKGTVVKNGYYLADDNSNVEVKARYYKPSGSIGNISISENQDEWYRGGREDSTPRLKNFAVAQTFTDVDGDGVAVEYTARDLAALRQHLLMDRDYKYIYGDIDRNGETNILDLVVLCNEMIGDYSSSSNAFWRNVKLGMVNIYYGENDSYDAARKLELYLEAALPGVDVKKVVSADKTVSGRENDANAVYVHSNDLVGKPTGELEIIVGDIANYSDYAKNSLDVNDYAITYDSQKGVLWFKGGSFTGVEQAVLDFASNSKVEIGEIYTVDTATLDEEKRAKTVLVDTNYDGKADTTKTMYYAWGDEFDGILDDAADDENDQLSIDTWNHQTMNTETNRGTAGTYRNVEGPNINQLSDLYWVKNGKLNITRGVIAEHATEESDMLGYVRLENPTGKDAFGGTIDDEDIIANPGLIKTNHSLLWKQGYAEMYGSLPSDGHTFASWWMLGHGSFNNYAIEETLFSKVYRLNNVGDYAYDGKSTWPESTNPATYKYQVPTNCFEIDIWELMQSCTLAHSSYQKTRTTGSYDYRLYLNVHKFYSVGSRGQATVNVIDWDNPGTPRAVMKKEWFGTPEDDYYFSTSAAYYDFTDGKITRYTTTKGGLFNSQTYVTANYAESLQIQLTAPRRYGFYWSTNGVDKFNFTLYIYDVNGDGIEGDDAILGTSDMTYNTQDRMNPQDYDCIEDAEVANQYMYFLIDNVLYTSNTKHNDATSDLAVMFTDMLTNEGTADNPDKIDLDVDYVRVYQYDGRRDIITRETEDFNNNNHFGY